LFGDVPSVWHKELLYAIASGAEVYGSSSMGALRAAELCPFGMVGVGTIFRLYRLGYLTDDDEVATLHSPEELHFAPLSEAMINLRYTLRRMRRKGMLSIETEQRAAAALKARFFGERSLAALIEHLSVENSVADSGTAVETAYFDVKARDARVLLHRLVADPPAKPRQRFWEFSATHFWKRQFELMSKELPALGTPLALTNRVPRHCHA
jgi:hypothetical protein